MKLGAQIEAVLRRLLETDGVEIVVRKSNEGDHAVTAERRRAANTKNVAAPETPNAQEAHETGTLSDNEKGDTLRPMVSMKQVLKTVPVSRSTLFRMIDAGNFPRSRPLSHGRVAWFEDEVKAWQKALDEGRKPGG